MSCSARTIWSVVTSLLAIAITVAAISAARIGETGTTASYAGNHTETHHDAAVRVDDIAGGAEIKAPSSSALQVIQPPVEIAREQPTAISWIAQWARALQLFVMWVLELGGVLVGVGYVSRGILRFSKDMNDGAKHILIGIAIVLFGWLVVPCIANGVWLPQQSGGFS